VFGSDGVCCNDDDGAIASMCCKQQFISYDDNDVRSNGGITDIDHPVCSPPTAAAASLANDFDSVGGPAECLDHHGLSSNTDSRLSEEDNSAAETVKSWQQSRSLIMLILGFVVWMCFSSAFLSPVIQVIGRLFCLLLSVEFF